MMWWGPLIVGLGWLAAAPAQGDESPVARRVLNNLHDDMAQCFAFYGISAEGLRKKNPQDGLIGKTEALLQTLLDSMAAIQKPAGLSDAVADERIQTRTKQQLEEIGGDSFNYSRLLDKYGQFCKSLVDDPESRRKQWVELESKRPLDSVRRPVAAPSASAVPPPPRLIVLTEVPPLADAGAVVLPAAPPPPTPSAPTAVEAKAVAETSPAASRPASAPAAPPPAPSPAPSATVPVAKEPLVVPEGTREDDEPVVAVVHPPAPAPTPAPAPPPVAAPVPAPVAQAAPPAPMPQATPAPAPVQVATLPKAPPPVAPVAVAASVAPPAAAAPPPPAPSPPRAAPQVAQATPAPAPAPVAGIDPAQAAMMLRRAEGLVAIGDLSGARLFYERLAVAGHKQAAMALARSYDVAWLRQNGVVGTPGDPARAAYWYERAATLAEAPAKP